MPEVHINRTVGYNRMRPDHTGPSDQPTRSRACNEIAATKRSPDVRGDETPFDGLCASACHSATCVRFSNLRFIALHCAHVTCNEFGVCATRCNEIHFLANRALDHKSTVSRHDAQFSSRGETLAFHKETSESILGKDRAKIETDLGQNVIHFGAWIGPIGPKPGSRGAT
jgi:hypothetical protein